MKDIAQRMVALGRSFGLDRALALVAGLLVVLLLVQGWRYAFVGRLERAVLQSLEQTASSPPERDKARELPTYDRIVEHGMLGSMPVKPVPKLWGIMGARALFGVSSDDAQPYKVGDNLSTGEKIVAIRLNDVVLEKDGKQRTEYVFEELRK